MHDFSSGRGVCGACLAIGIAPAHDVAAEWSKVWIRVKTCWRKVEVRGGDVGGHTYVGLCLPAADLRFPRRASMHQIVCHGRFAILGGVPGRVRESVAASTNSVGVRRQTLVAGIAKRSLRALSSSSSPASPALRKVSVAVGALALGFVVCQPLGLSCPTLRSWRSKYSLEAGSDLISHSDTTESSLDATARTPGAVG